jgi:hypothetical protein
VTLQTDLGKLERLIAELGDVVLLVVDPITAYLGDRDQQRPSLLVVTQAGTTDNHMV